VGAQETLESLDSRVRGNDGKGRFPAIYKAITIEFFRVHSPQLAAVAVIPAEAGIQINGLDSVSSTA
jgi:hypothetical protein